jgi:hypothetical protein
VVERGRFGRIGGGGVGVGLKRSPCSGSFYDNAISKKNLVRFEIWPFGGRFGGVLAVIFTKTMPFNGNFPRFRRLGDLYHKTK